jgi:thiamine-monophosphate kinase
MPLGQSSHQAPVLSEFALIRSLRRRFGRTDSSVVRGIGEDAAIIKMPTGSRLLLTTDLLAEGVHFDLATTTLQDVGYRAAVANLSDIAAMGGVPRYLLVSLAVPHERTAAEIDRLYRGLMQACRRYGVQLVGGDTSASRNGLFVNITLTGAAHPDRVLTRAGARAGDLIYVTGTLGDSQAGLALLQAGDRASASLFDKGADRIRRFLIRRHLRPLARVREGRLLAERRLASAAIDLSDGLSGDLAHLCEESRVGAELDPRAIPVSSACRSYADVRRLNPVDVALSGGEDYELLFTVPPANRRKVEALARRARFRVSCIGLITARRSGIRVKRDDGSWQPLTVTSYEHFRR